MTPDHYFTADPTTADARTSVRLSAWGLDLTLTTSSGVFSAQRIDRGTSVLFRQLQPPRSGRILDLGCGYGAIGLAIAAASPGTTVVGVDVNRRAVDLANQNAGRLDLADRFHACEPADTPAGPYDEIWSNPPIRIGKDALHDLLVRWLARLVPDGRAVLVVGRNLGADSLQRWLTDHEYPTTRVGSAKGFRVLAVAPRPTGSESPDPPGR